MRRLVGLFAFALAAHALADPSVGTDAAVAAPVPATTDAPEAHRLFSRAFTTFIHAEPRKGARQLGYVRVGTSVALRAREPVAGQGCAGGFLPVEPRGWVCLDRTATLDPAERYVHGMQLAAPSAAPLPFRFALSNGAPMYTRLPSPSEWEKAERPLGHAGSHDKLSWGNRGHELLAEARVEAPTDPIPFFLEAGGSIGSDRPLGLVRRQIPNGSMLAYTRVFEHEGRSFVLSSDGTAVPADRVRPFKASSFEGIELGDSLALPIAWMRKTPRSKHRLGPDGALVPTGESWPERTFVALDASADTVVSGGKGYLRTRERDAGGAALYVAEKDATAVRLRETLPFGVGESDKWIVVSISRGTLVAYEGRRPVFATLMSPGAGGIPVRGGDAVRQSTTPLGVHRVTYKHRAATMSPEKGENRSFWIADVPYTQYFQAPFAIHTAYWHERFGEPMSAGCINLSPKDGARLFAWTDPQVPDGWNGAGAGGDNGKGTFIVVER